MGMGELYSATTNFQTRQINTGGDYVKPSHVDFDKRFVVKVQASADTSPIFLYDETRECLFYIKLYIVSLIPLIYDCIEARRYRLQRNPRRS